MSRDLPATVGAGLRLATPDATERLGRQIGAVLRVGDVIALHGPLGAGKTTLARGILRGLGHRGEVPSPTFTLVQVYEPPLTRLPVWHVDLYRIENPEEIGELGLEEAGAEGAMLIEWPERLTRPWPEALRLDLEPDRSGARGLTAWVPAAWEARWPPR